MALTRVFFCRQINSLRETYKKGRLKSRLLVLRNGFIMLLKVAH